MAPEAMHSAIAAIMIHVPEAEAGLAWYEQAFPSAQRVRLEAPPAFECLSVGGVFIEVVPADSKVSNGAAGSVVYWRVADFESALSQMQKAGATLYRGPMLIENGESMCQVQDPWGNCIGLRGPSSSGFKHQ